MIRLTTTTASLQFVLNGAVTTNQLTAHASYYDLTAQTRATFEEVRGAKSHKSSNNTTDVTLVDAPLTNGVVRMIDYISVNNADTVAAEVIIKIDDSAASPTEVILFRKSLSAKETVTWSKYNGWQVL